MKWLVRVGEEQGIIVDIQRELAQTGAVASKGEEGTCRVNGHHQFWDQLAIKVKDFESWLARCCVLEVGLGNAQLLIPPELQMHQASVREQRV